MWMRQYSTEYNEARSAAPLVLLTTRRWKRFGFAPWGERPEVVIRQSSAIPTEASRNAEFLLRPRAGAQGVLVLGDPEQSSEAEESVPVYLEAARDLVRVAVTFALGDHRSQLRFEAAAETPPSLARDGQLSVVAVAWLEGVSVRAGGRLLLGYVVGPAGAAAKLKVMACRLAG
jgi:hypothetical protein